MTDEQHTPEEMDTILTNLTTLAESRRESCCSSPSACSALLTAYAETCRHIEELERIQAGSKQMVFTIEAKKLAALLIERILVLTPNRGVGSIHGKTQQNKAISGKLK